MSDEAIARIATEAERFLEGAHAVCSVLLPTDEYPPVSHLRRFSAELSTRAAALSAADSDDSRLGAGLALLTFCRRYETLANLQRYLGGQYAPRLHGFITDVILSQEDLARATPLLERLLPSPFEAPGPFDLREVGCELSALAHVPLDPYWDEMAQLHRAVTQLEGALRALQEELTLPGDTETLREREELRALEEQLKKLEDEATVMARDIQALTEDKNALRAANTQLKQDNAAMTKKAEQSTAAFSLTQKKVQELPLLRKLLESIAAAVAVDDG
jgi:hypothetical protein